MFLLSYLNSIIGADADLVLPVTWIFFFKLQYTRGRHLSVICICDWYISFCSLSMLYFQANKIKFYIFVVSLI